MEILYLGPASGTSLDRSNAIRRCGHTVLHLDPRTYIAEGRIINNLIWRFGGAIFEERVARGLLHVIGSRHFDICIVDGGELVGPKVIQALRQIARYFINYNIDDPFGKRDGKRFSLYRNSVPAYDLIVVVRDENVAEAHSAGAKKVKRVYRSADEVSHAPLRLTAKEAEYWSSSVLFVGTWMEDRGAFCASLLDAGVPLTIFGARWDRAKEWSQLRNVWKGGHLEGGDYVAAIQCAIISLGMLSKGNRDLHTTRTMEIPSIGGLLCAPRTSEHQSLYVENEEAIFWDDAAECAASCLELLADRDRARNIAARGHLRFLKGANKNETVMTDIINDVTQR